MTEVDMFADINNDEISVEDIFEAIGVDNNSSSVSMSIDDKIAGLRKKVEKADKPSENIMRKSMNSEIPSFEDLSR